MNKVIAFTNLIHRLEAMPNDSIACELAANTRPLLELAKSNARNRRQKLRSKLRHARKMLEFLDDHFLENGWNVQTIAKYKKYLKKEKMARLVLAQ